MFFLEVWDHLEVVVKCVVAPKDNVFNGLVTRAHIRGLKGRYELRFKNMNIACGSGRQRGLGLGKYK